MRMWCGRARSVLTAGVLAGLLLFCADQPQAAVFFDDSFEGATPEASGWTYAQGWCYYNVPTRSNPCPEIDLSTEVAYAGSKSVKATYKAEWSDPNPQTHDQAINRKFPATTDIYVRYYYRTNKFTYTAASGTKHIYYKSMANTSPNFFSINWFGSRELGFAGQIIAEICPTSGSGPYGSCNYYPNVASVPLNDNVWYCIEEHIKMNTPGVDDGVLEIWVNGVRTLGYYSERFRGTQVSGPNGNSSNAYFDFLQIYKQNGDGLMYYDQFAVGNTRIGCTAGSAPQDSTPPASPTGLTLR